MIWLVDHPILFFVVTLVLFLGSTTAGVLARLHGHKLTSAERAEFDLVRNAMFTLLGLIIGFAIAMAVSRYDVRKGLEESEANAIGTEYVRADLLPAADAAMVRELLKNYIDQRVLFCETRNGGKLARIDAQTWKLQSELWSVVQSIAAKQPTPTVALAVSGMNDVLNSQGYTQAAWWNRLPPAAWGLLLAISIFSALLIGYGAHRRSVALFLVLPLAVSISFFLIADIDSPRRGLIRVLPQNLASLSQSLRTP